MSPRIIGVHEGPDASACLLVGNVLVTSIARERLTRVKHDGGDPVECVDYLLEHAGLRPADIDLVVRCGPHDATAQASPLDARYSRVLTTRHHHLLHAYAASLMAPASPALVLVTDGRGGRAEDNSEIRDILNIGITADTGKAGDCGMGEALYEVESVYLHEAGRLTRLEQLYRPFSKARPALGDQIDSLGWAYAAVSRKIFGSVHAAGKVMALAALAPREHAIPAPLDYGDGRRFAINHEWLDFLASCPDALAWDTSLAADLSDSIQQGLEGYMAYRTQQLSRRYQCGALLLGGGVALNCKNNGLLANARWLHHVDVFPAAGNDGLAVGAAVMALRETFGDCRPIVYRVSQGAVGRVGHALSMPQSEPFPDRQTAHQAAEQADPAASAAPALARLLADGCVIGVFQGGSEFGPRALGYRSILSPATDSAFKARLNAQIKHREAFRPFGGIVLQSRLEQLTHDALAGPNMLSAASMEASARARYPALAHVDGTVRLQVVQEDGGLLHRILVAYEMLTGHVALINTSFNGCDEPIVETLQQARACAAAIGLDWLYANGTVEQART